MINAQQTNYDKEENMDVGVQDYDDHYEVTFKSGVSVDIGK